MSKTATQTVEETEASPRFSVSSLFSARSDATLTPKREKFQGYVAFGAVSSIILPNAILPAVSYQVHLSPQSRPDETSSTPANSSSKYFQPDERKLAAASDGDVIEVPVHEIHMPRRKTINVIGRMNDRLMGGVGPNEEFKLLRMSKLEYTKYWARDERGNYVGTEPEGVGHERLKAQGW